jgi:hypothetical protein
MLSSFLTAIFSSIQNCPSAHRMSSVSPKSAHELHLRAQSDCASSASELRDRQKRCTGKISLPSARCTERLRQVSTFLYSWFISGPQMPQQQAPWIKSISRAEGARAIKYPSRAARPFNFSQGVNLIPIIRKTMSHFRHPMRYSESIELEFGRKLFGLRRFFLSPSVRQEKFGSKLRETCAG